MMLIRPEMLGISVLAIHTRIQQCITECKYVSLPGGKDVDLYSTSHVQDTFNAHFRH